MPLVESIAFDWHGESLVAHADRSLEWPARRTLFVADLHLGKGTSYRMMGIPVPSGTTEGTLTQLSQVVDRKKIDHLVILGDLWHARTSRSELCLQEFRTWRLRHQNVRVTLVIGNHDRRAGAFPGESIDEVAEGFEMTPFECRHHPPEDGGTPSLAGHLHPSFSAAGKRMKAFWIRPGCIVLPAFGEFTGSMRPTPEAGHRFIAILEGRHLCDFQL